MKLEQINNPYVKDYMPKAVVEAILEGEVETTTVEKEVAYINKLLAKKKSELENDPTEIPEAAAVYA